MDETDYFRLADHPPGDEDSGILGAMAVSGHASHQAQWLGENRGG